jgi:predicted helicase
MNKATIYYCDIGDYLSREEKLAIIKKMGSVANPAMDGSRVKKVVKFSVRLSGRR